MTKSSFAVGCDVADGSIGGGDGRGRGDVGRLGHERIGWSRGGTFGDRSKYAREGEEWERRRGGVWEDVERGRGGERNRGREREGLVIVWLSSTTMTSSLCGSDLLILLTAISPPTSPHTPALTLFPVKLVFSEITRSLFESFEGPNSIFVLGVTGFIFPLVDGELEEVARDLEKSLKEEAINSE
jgi:hypothetical protein